MSKLPITLANVSIDGNSVNFLRWYIKDRNPDTVDKGYRVNIVTAEDHHFSLSARNDRTNQRVRIR